MSVFSLQSSLFKSMAAFKNKCLLLAAILLFSFLLDFGQAQKLDALPPRVCQSPSKRFPYACLNGAGCKAVCTKLEGFFTGYCLLRRCICAGRC